MAVSLRRVVPLVFFALAGPALAHGAFPQTLAVKVRPESLNELLVTTSFGLLRSTDRGASWRYLCEEAIGFGTGQIPAILYSPSGALFAGSFQGLFVSRDGACNWSRLAAFDEPGVAALARTSVGLVAASGKFGVTNDVFWSGDDGVTWTSAGVSNGLRFYTSAVAAPSLPSRVYVGAWWYEPMSTFALRSDDGGKSFTSLETTTAIPVQGPLLALAVHPTNPEVVLFAANDDPGDPSVLLRSTDGARTFNVVHEGFQPFNSAAFSADGNTVLAASYAGLVRSTDQGATFAPLDDPKQNGCVAIDGDAYFACAWPELDGFALGKGQWANPGLSSSLTRWRDIEGPLDCPMGSNEQQACDAVWPVVLASFPLDDGGVPVVPDAGPAADAGTEPPPMNKPCGCGVTPGASLGLALLAFSRRRAARIR